MAPGTQEDAGAVEETVGLIKVGRAHRQVPGIYGVAQAYGALDARRQLPGVLVGSRDLQLLPAGPGRQTDDVPGELPDHVTAGNPRRQGEYLPGRIRIVELQADFKQMRGGMDSLDGVADGSGHGRRREGREWPGF